MAAWQEGVNGTIDIDFDVSDLLLFNIQNTKKTLSEVLEYSSFKITTKNVQEIDSAGLQLLIYFITKITSAGGQVLFETPSPELINLCSLYGIEDIATVEKINKSSNDGGFSDV